MPILRSLELRPLANMPQKFPYTLAFLRDLPKIEFASEVTFLVGENGSGKSTFLEALACAVGSITVGSESVQTDPSLQLVREFSTHLKLVWSKRTRRLFHARKTSSATLAKWRRCVLTWNPTWLVWIRNTGTARQPPRD